MFPDYTTGAAHPDKAPEGNRTPNAPVMSRHSFHVTPREQQTAGWPPEGFEPSSPL